MPYGNLSSLFYELRHTFAKESEINFYVSFVKNKKDKMLEAMSGAGRLLIPLLQQGYNVEGVDCSSAMLERCKMRCASLQLQPALYEQSLEKLSLPQQYAVIIIAYGSFQLIADRACALQALKNLHAHMVNGGILLLDFFIPEITPSAYYDEQLRIDEKSYLKTSRRTLFDVEKKLAQAICTYTLYVDGKAQQYEDELVELTWYSDEDLCNMVQEAGFKVKNIVTQYFDGQETSRILVAQKIF